MLPGLDEPIFVSFILDFLPGGRHEVVKEQLISLACMAERDDQFYVWSPSDAFQFRSPGENVQRISDYQPSNEIEFPWNKAIEAATYACLGERRRMVCIITDLNREQDLQMHVNFATPTAYDCEFCFIQVGNKSSNLVANLLNQVQGRYFHIEVANLADSLLEIFKEQSGEKTV